MIFFNPRPAFIKWLEQYASKRLIVDMGCGTGALMAAYWRVNKRENIIGVDPRFYELVEVFGRVPNCPTHRVLAQEGKDSIVTPLPNSLVVFARPCHSGWVQETIENLHTTSEVLYISKPLNCEIDLDPGTYVELQTPKAGTDGERVYRVEHHAKKRNTSHQQKRKARLHHKG